MATKELRRDRRTSPQMEIDRLSDTSWMLADLPRPRWALMGVLPVSLLFGYLATPWGGDDGAAEWLAYSLWFFALPAWLGALFSLGYLRLIGGKAYLYRTALLALINLLFVGLVLLAGWALGPVLEMPDGTYLLLGYSALVMVLHLTHLMTATGRWALALPATLAQPLLGISPILYAHYRGLGDWSVHERAPELAIISVVAFLAVGQLAMYIGTRPLAKNYGVDGVGTFRAFLEHWISGGEAGRQEMEAFFSVFSEHAYANASVLAFRERGGGVPIATVLVPSLHPGPWGELGGADLPRKVSLALGDRHGEVLTFHGASDHDMNPSTMEEMDKLFSAVKVGLASLEEWSERASAFVRLSDGFDACAQAFNGTVLAVHTSAPNPTDDVDGATGHLIETALEDAGASPGVFVDGHNCLEPGVGGVAFGTPKARRLQERLVEAAGKALAAEDTGLRVGVSHARAECKLRSMGPTGIQALVVEAGGSRTAWILADGNNAMPGLRERARERVKGMVDEAELFTTDNHIVNVTVGGFNPVGLRDPEERILECIERAVREATEGIRDAEAAGTRVHLGEVLVWGKGNTIRLSANINAAVSASKVALSGAVAAAFLISLGAAWLL